MRRLLALAIVALALPAYPAARLTYMVNSVAVPVSWQSSAFPLRYAIDRRVVTAKPGIEDVVARAVGEWTGVGDAQLSFASAGVVDGATAGRDGVNSITLADDLFQNQHYYAITTNWYDDSGHMTEADIQIDPTTLSGSCDLQQLFAHELGHMLGLDHSGVLSSVMYPYVGKVGVPSLDSDDSIAISEIYPHQSRDGGATLEGRVLGDAGPIFAAQVVA
ncbi:MAG TPA: matrixin family metalloprotease, partial [Thermoanaerobaculia bacterium]|nr:matrixin family metalloprotease [Thermoanaerobaculia bacterium]